MGINLIRISQAKPLFYLYLLYLWPEERFLLNLDNFRLTSVVGRLFWYCTLCVIEGVSALVNTACLLRWSMMVLCAKKEKWMLLRFLIWETDRLVGQDTFTPKNSVPHKFGVTVLNM